VHKVGEGKTIFDPRLIPTTSIRGIISNHVALPAIDNMVRRGVSYCLLPLCLTSKSFEKTRIHN